MKTKDIILLVGGISFVIFVILLSLLLGNHFQVTSCGCPKLVSHNFVYLFVILAVIFIGCLVYYLLSLKIESQKESINKNLKLVLSFLDDKEKQILNEMIKNNGEMMQDKLTGKFGKLNTHRTIKKMKLQGIINIEKTGKTNKISLKNELRRELI